MLEAAHALDHHLDRNFYWARISGRQALPSIEHLRLAMQPMIMQSTTARRRHDYLLAESLKMPATIGRLWLNSTLCSIGSKMLASQADERLIAAPLRDTPLHRKDRRFCECAVLAIGRRPIGARQF